MGSKLENTIRTAVEQRINESTYQAPENSAYSLDEIKSVMSERMYKEIVDEILQENKKKIAEEIRTLMESERKKTPTSL